MKFYLLISPLVLCFFVHAGEITNERIEIAFRKIYLKKLLGQANRTIHEEEMRIIPIKKENVDVILFMEDRKVYTREILVNTTSKINGSTFCVNATAVYLDTQETGNLHVTGTIEQKPVNETGKMSVEWDRMRKSVVVKKAEFNETHVNGVEVAPEVDWGSPQVKISGVELVKYVTNDEIKSAFEEHLKIKQKAHEETFANLEPESVDRRLIDL